MQDPALYKNRYLYTFLHNPVSDKPCHPSATRFRLPYLKRVPLYAGELYGTDQYKDGDAQDTNIGKLLEVNIDGKWQVATTGTSRFEFAGVMDDNGHKLIMISVLPEAKTVA